MKIHAPSFHKQVKILSLVSQPVVIFFICYLMSNSQVWEYSYGDYKPSQVPEVLYYKLKKQEAHARFNHCCMYTHAPSRDRGLTGLGEGSRVSGQEPTPSGWEGMGGGPRVRWDSKPQSLAQVSHGDSFTKPKSKKNLVKTSKQ